MIERSNDAEKSERPYWFEDTPTLDPALSAQLPEHIPTPAQAEPVQLHELSDEDYDAFTKALGVGKPPTQKLIDLMRGYDEVQKAAASQSHSSAGKESEPPEGQLAGRDCPGVLESDPALFNILNNALGTMHYHRLMSALNWNGYVITREPQSSWQPIETAPKDGTDVLLHYDGRAPVVAAWFRGGWAPMDLGGNHLVGDPTNWQRLPASPLSRPQHSSQEK